MDSMKNDSRNVISHIKMNSSCKMILNEKFYEKKMPLYINFILLFFAPNHYRALLKLIQGKEISKNSIPTKEMFNFLMHERTTK